MLKKSQFCLSGWGVTRKVHKGGLWGLGNNPVSLSEVHGCVDPIKIYETAP
jgi:hypothetical protein